MLQIQNALLTTRNVVLAPLRIHRLDQLCLSGQAPGMVVFYHRIADQHPNGWSLSCDEFRRHLDHFQSIFRLVDLAEIQRRVRDGVSFDRSLSITFDDGYQENAQFALPLMIQRRIPCTYFISTQHVLQQKSFAHDLKANRPLPVHTAADIRRWSDGGIEMGCHTRNHVDFATVHDRETMRREIVDAKDELEQITGKRCRYFAFPFGMPQQLTQAAIELVHEAGFDGFCSGYGAYNKIGEDWFHIRRFHGDPEFSRVCNWTSYDSRKDKLQSTIQYCLPPARSLDETTQMLRTGQLHTGAQNANH